MELLISMVKIAVVVFAGACLLLYVFQGRMIFYPQPLTEMARKEYREHEMRIKINGTELHGWFVQRDDPLIIYYGGNAEEISVTLSEVERFKKFSLLFMNYRGYGLSRGKPSQDLLLADAVAIFDYMVTTKGIDPGRVILMGRSLGTGVATHVAANRRVDRVLLVTPFDSLVTVAQAHYPVFPVSRLLRHRFDSALLAPRIKVPMLNLMAGRDEIIPASSSNHLARLWGGRVHTVVVENAGHNDISCYPSYWKSIGEFLGTENYPDPSDPGKS